MPPLNKNSITLMIMAFLMSCANLSAQIADRDGNNYNVVNIGKQEWMAENLNTSHFRNGDSIPEIEDAALWQTAGNQGKPAWCYYNNDSTLGKSYHKLYNWYAVMDPRGLAPDGWHVPSMVEWADLMANLGGENIAGLQMKATKVWNGMNESGFTALPGGYRNYNAVFSHVRNIASWWSASESGATDAWSISLSNSNGAVGRSYDGKRVGLSVRCLRN